MLKRIPFKTLDKKVRAAGLFSFLLFASLDGYADAHNRYLKTSILVSNSLFVESVNGEALNEETGNFLIGQLTYYQQFNNGLFYELNYQQNNDTLDYDGYTQGGLRFQTESEYYVNAMQAVLGRKSTKAASYLGLASHYRERNILASTVGNLAIRGLYEELRWQEIIIGFDYYLSQSSNKHLKLTTQASTSIYSDFNVQFSNEYDPSQFRPGQNIALYAAVEYYFDLAYGFGVHIVPSYKYSKIGASRSVRLFKDGVKQGASFNLPQTEFQELSLELGISKHF